MRTLLSLAALAALCGAGLLSAQQTIPTIEGETLSGHKASLPSPAGNQPVLLIIGFTHASQTQTKEWSLRVRDRVPAWSIVVLQDVPRLIRGMVTHAVKGSVPKDQYDHFLVVNQGEKLLKQAVGFDKPDDAYLVVIDGAGVVHWTFHGPVTDGAVEQLHRQFAQ